MDEVALAATIGGAVVGLAGVGVTAWSGWLQRQSAKEVAGLQHQHERELARGTRLFERRAPTYEQLLSHLYVWQDRVNATEREATRPGDPDAPDPPNFDEWRMMLVRLRTYGSSAVADGFDAYWKAIEAFYESVDQLRRARDHGGPGNAGELAQKVLDTRPPVGEKRRELERLVSEDLAAL